MRITYISNIIMNLIEKLQQALAGQDFQDKWRRDKSIFWKIFEAKFCDLNIDEEYKYNLAYLITHDYGESSAVSDSYLRNKLPCKILNKEQSLNLGDYVSKSETNKAGAIEKHEKLRSAAKPSKEDHTTSKGILVNSRLIHPVHVIDKNAQLLTKGESNNHVLSFGKLECEAKRPVPLSTRKHKPTPILSKSPTFHCACTYISELGPKHSCKQPTQNASITNGLPTSLVHRDSGFSLYKTKLIESSRFVRQTTKEISHHENSVETIQMHEASIDETHIPPVASRIKEFTTIGNSCLSTSQRANYPRASKANDSAPSHPRNRLQPELQRSATYNGGRYLVVNSEKKCVDCCDTCHKRVYPMDRVSIGERAYHKSCFRCVICQRTLLPGNFASLDGTVLCKPHYIEQFRRRGRYELRNSNDSNSSINTSSAPERVTQNGESQPTRLPKNELPLDAASAVTRKQDTSQKPKLQSAGRVDKPSSRISLKTH
ncbi:unnamed protein product [Dicrocoelium dendriticum]|nr:unnamed protein product [Dicrocoelium dendriticum]